MSLHPDIQIGSTLLDNDPRQEGRTIRVTALFPNGVGGIASKTGRGVRILAHRIHCDGKARKSGFSLVREAQS